MRSRCRTSCCVRGRPAAGRSRARSGRDGPAGRGRHRSGAVWPCGRRASARGRGRHPRARPADVLLAPAHAERDADPESVARVAHRAPAPGLLAGRLRARTWHADRSTGPAERLHRVRALVPGAGRAECGPAPRHAGGEDRRRLPGSRQGRRVLRVPSRRRRSRHLSLRAPPARIRRTAFGAREPFERPRRSGCVRRQARGGHRWWPERDRVGGAPAGVRIRRRGDHAASCAALGRTRDTRGAARTAVLPPVRRRPRPRQPCRGASEGPPTTTRRGPAGVRPAIDRPRCFAVAAAADHRHPGHGRPARRRSVARERSPRAEARRRDDSSRGSRGARDRVPRRRPALQLPGPDGARSPPLRGRLSGARRWARVVRPRPAFPRRAGGAHLRAPSAFRVRKRVRDPSARAVHREGGRRRRRGAHRSCRPAYAASASILVSGRVTTAPGGALVLGSDYKALGIVRSLGRRGIRVWVLRDDHLLAGWSRYSRRALSWPATGESERVDHLLELCRRHSLGGWMLLPAGDEEAALLSRNRDALAEHYRVTVPSWDVLRWAYDKRLTYQLAADLGIDHPRTAAPRGRDEVLAFAGRYPAILKPAVRPTLNRFTIAKAWLVEDHATLLARYDEACTLIDPDLIMIQELIPG